MCTKFASVAVAILFLLMVSGDAKAAFFRRRSMQYAPPQAPMQAPSKAPMQAPSMTPLQAPKQAPQQAPMKSPMQAPSDGSFGSSFQAQINDLDARVDRLEAQRRP